MCSLGGTSDGNLQSGGPSTEFKSGASMRWRMSSARFPARFVSLPNGRIARHACARSSDRRAAAAVRAPPAVAELKVAVPRSRPGRRMAEHGAHGTSGARGNLCVEDARAELPAAASPAAAVLDATVVLDAAAALPAAVVLDAAAALP